MFKFLMILILHALFLIGCTNSQSQEDAHLEHIVPAHQPKSYPETVDQLRQRFKNLFSENNTSDSARAELEDIIRWLPDLAGDSELRKSDWEHVCQLQLKLIDALKAHDTSPNKSTLMQQIHPILDELEALKMNSITKIFKAYEQPAE